MSTAKDAARIAALVTAVESLSEGKPTSLGERAVHVFGWKADRVFLAIDHAVARGFIARNGDGQVSKVSR